MNKIQQLSKIQMDFPVCMQTMKKLCLSWKIKCKIDTSKKGFAKIYTSKKLINDFFSWD